MIIDRSFAPFIVYCEDSILNALAQISSNKSRIVFSVTESGYLEGVLSDGDFRRWIVGERGQLLVPRTIRGGSILRAV